MGCITSKEENNLDIQCEEIKIKKCSCITKAQKLLLHHHSERPHYVLARLSLNLNLTLAQRYTNQQLNRIQTPWVPVLRAYLQSQVKNQVILQREKKNLKEIIQAAQVQIDSSEQIPKDLICDLVYSEQIQSQRQTFKNSLSDSHIDTTQDQQTQVEIRSNTVLQNMNQPVVANILIYRTITDVMEKQILNPLHPIYQMIQIYLNFLIRCYSTEKKAFTILNVQKTNSQSYTSVIGDVYTQVNEDETDAPRDLIVDVRTFLNFIFHVTWKYYELTEVQRLVKDDNYLNSTHITNFVCSLIFQEKLLYDLVFDHLMHKYQAEVDILKDNILKKYPIRIEDYDISPEFQLNINTINSYSSKDSDYLPINVHKGYEQPYQKAINTLKYMNKVHGPIAQLKLLTKTFWCLDEAILTFYKVHDMKPVRITDADTLLNIFTYILIKSQVYQLPVVCKFIESFVVKSLLNSQAGYLLVTVQSCIQFVSNF